MIPLDQPGINVMEGTDRVFLALNQSVDPNTDEDWKNVSAWIQQTKEEREAKAERKYIGNGKIVWSSGSTTTQDPQSQYNQAVNQQQATAGGDAETDDLPF